MKALTFLSFFSLLKFFTLLMFCINVSFMYSQQEIDSLIIILKAEKNINKKAELYYELSKKSENINLLIDFANKGLALSKKSKQTNLQLEILLHVITYYRNINRFNEAFQWVEKINNLAAQTKDSTIYATYFEQKGILYERTGDYNKSVKYYKKSLLFYKDSSSIPDVYSNMGYSYSMLYQDSLAMKSYLKGIEIANKIGKENSLSFLYNNLGSLFYYIGDLDKSIEYFNKSMKLSQKLKLYHILNSSYGFLGNAYLEKGEYDKAIEYDIKAYKLAEKRNDVFSLELYKENLGRVYLFLNDLENSLKYYYAAYEIIKKNKKLHYKEPNILNSIAESYLEMGKLDSCAYYLDKTLSMKNVSLPNLSDAYLFSGQLFLAKKQYNDAIVNFEKNLLLLKKLQERPNIETYLGLGDSHDKLNNYKMAIEYYEKARQMKPENLEQKIYLHLKLSQNYEALGELKKALFFLKQTMILKDSLYESNILKHSLKLKEEFETQQKEAEILRLSNENLRKEAELNEIKNMVYLSLGLFLITLTSILFLWYKRKQKIKLQILESSIKASETEKIRIGKELHDGIAGSLIHLIHEMENKDMAIADKLLKTYDEIRNLSHQLNNKPIHGETLFERLEEIIPENNSKQKFMLIVNPLDLKLPEPYGTHIFRIVQELIANNLKHAQATFTKIKIQLNDNELNIHYNDDGIGLHDIKQGNGLRNIEDRVAIMGGKIHYQTKKGFHIIIKIPFIQNTMYKA